MILFCEQQNCGAKVPGILWQLWVRTFWMMFPSQTPVFLTGIVRNGLSSQRTHGTFSFSLSLLISSDVSTSTNGLASIFGMQTQRASHASYSLIRPSSRTQISERPFSSESAIYRIPLSQRCQFSGTRRLTPSGHRPAGR